MKNGKFEEARAVKWYKDDLLHRDDGPAIEYYNGDFEWYFEGKIHRIGGPAYSSFFHKYQEWFEMNKLHRIDGPAIIHVDKYQEWFYKGKRINCSSQSEFEKLLKLKAFM